MSPSSAAWLPLVAFVVLGLPAGILGVTWPSMRAAVGAPLAVLGLVLAVSTVTYFLSAAATGPLTSRIGIRWLLVLSCVAAGVGCLLFASAHALLVALAGSALVGLGSGAFDAGVNAYVSLNYGVRLMGWLHAAWSVGAGAGPLLVSASLGTPGSWRSAYLVATLAFVVIALLSIQQGRGWPRSTPSGPAAVSRVEAGREQPTMALVAAALPFFLFAGLEMATGQWSFSQLTGGRRVPSGLASVGVSLFWFGMAAGRMLLGSLGHRLAPIRLLDLGAGLCVLGALFYWLAPPLVSTLVALPAIGVGVSVLYPVAIILTPSRVGSALATHAIGYQIAFGTVGGAAVPAIIGIGLQSIGPSLLGPAISAVAAALLLLHLGTRQSAGHAAGHPAS